MLQLEHVSVPFVYLQHAEVACSHQATSFVTVWVHDDLHLIHSVPLQGLGGVTSTQHCAIATPMTAPLPIALGLFSDTCTSDSSMVIWISYYSISKKLTSPG